MQRSRLKNIVNKSKEIVKPVVGEFEQFKNSLPIEIDDNYRLEAAWKAYGKPKNYQEALWEGLVQPIDDKTFKMPSIGYNEETEEYEYLNKGKENETVNKDIRVWDNDVIPFVKELKQGGYIRVYNDEKDCWTYAKGGSVKPKYEDWLKTLPKDKSNTYNYDLEKAFNELPWEELEAFRTNPEVHLPGDYKKPNHPTYSDEGYGWHGSDEQGWTFVVSPRQAAIHDFDWYQNYWNNYEPNSTLVFGNNTYKATKYLKQGGQMNVIPEGALHARKNNMEGAGEDFTAKGIPVVDNNGEQQAEIERNEVIFNKELTDFIESNYKKFKSEETKNSEKDEIVIKVGKRLVKELLTNTDDRTGLISEVEQKM